MRIERTSIVLALAWLATPACLDASASANLILNPSFEEPLLARGAAKAFYAGDTIGVGWVADGPSNSVVVTNQWNANPNLFWQTTSGNQFIYINNATNNSSIHQDIALEGSTEYHLSFDLANFKTPYFSRDTWVNIAIFGTGGSSFSFIRTFRLPPGAGYASRSLDFMTSTSGKYRLSVGSPSVHVGVVDNFSLTSKAVPEPSSLLSAALGLSTLAGIAAHRLPRPTA